MYVTIFLNCHNGLANPLRKIKKLCFKPSWPRKESKKEKIKMMNFIFIHMTFQYLVLYYGFEWSYGSSETVAYLVWSTWKSVVVSLKVVCSLQSFFTKLRQNFLYINKTWKYAIFAYFCNGNLYSLCNVIRTYQQKSIHIYI